MIPGPWWNWNRSDIPGTMTGRVGHRPGQLLHYFNVYMDWILDAHNEYYPKPSVKKIWDLNAIAFASEVTNDRRIGRGIRDFFAFEDSFD